MFADSCLSLVVATFRRQRFSQKAIGNRRFSQGSAGSCRVSKKPARRFLVPPLRCPNSCNLPGLSQTRGKLPNKCKSQQVLELQLPRAVFSLIEPLKDRGVGFEDCTGTSAIRFVTHRTFQKAQNPRKI